MVATADLWVYNAENFCVSSFNQVTSLIAHACIFHLRVGKIQKKFFWGLPIAQSLMQNTWKGEGKCDWNLNLTLQYGLKVVKKVQSSRDKEEERHCVESRRTALASFPMSGLWIFDCSYIICASSVSARQPTTTGLLKPRLLAGGGCNTLTRLLKRFATSFTANVVCVCCHVLICENFPSCRLWLRIRST